MPFTQFIEYKGKKILRIDIDSTTVETFEDMLKESGELIRKEPEGSVLSLAAGGPNTPIFTNKELFVKYLVANAPYMKASVVSGLDKMKAAMFIAVVSASGRQLMLFSSEQEAKEWLISQI